jgi:hypothetical protein
MSLSAAAVAIRVPQIGKALEFCKTDLPSNIEGVFPEWTECFRNVVCPGIEGDIQ